MIGSAIEPIFSICDIGELMGDIICLRNEYAEIPHVVGECDIKIGLLEQILENRGIYAKYATTEFSVYQGIENTPCTKNDIGLIVRAELLDEKTGKLIFRVSFHKSENEGYWVSKCRWREK